MAEVCLSAQQAPAADISGNHEELLTTHRPITPERGGWREYSGTPPTARTTRRRFTAEYKLRILREADQCAKPGDLGVLLQREGLYSSHLCAWRRQREAGARDALAPQKRGRKPARNDSLARENQLLLRENQHLHARLRQAEMIVAMQAKVSDILGIPLTAPDGPASPLVLARATPLSGQPEQAGDHRGHRT